MDETGAVVGYDDYDPWCKVLAGRSLATPWSAGQGTAMNKFTGKLFDDDYGLNWYYFGARYYDADVGRWWSVDPLADSLHSLSPYVYTFNSPIVFTDPNGLLGYRNDSTGVYQWFDDDPGKGWTMVFPGSKKAWEAGLIKGDDGKISFDKNTAVLTDIKNSGFDAFLTFINNSNFGIDFFLSEIKHIPVQARFWHISNSLLLSRQIATWGHQNLGNFDELRHKIGSFLLAAEYGPIKALIITSGNEYYGLYALDLTRGRFFNAVLNTKDMRTAFQWHDLRNNIYGIRKALKFRRSK